MSSSHKLSRFSSFNINAIVQDKEYRRKPEGDAQLRTTRKEALDL